MRLWPRRTPTEPPHVEWREEIRIGQPHQVGPVMAGQTIISRATCSRCNEPLRGNQCPKCHYQFTEEP